MKDLVIACVAAIGLASQASAVSDIFSDAVIWRRGFVGEGLIPQESSIAFPESLKQGVPSDPSHTAVVKGVYSSNGNGILMRKETVRYSYANLNRKRLSHTFLRRSKRLMGEMQATSPHLNWHPRLSYRIPAMLDIPSSPDSVGMVHCRARK